MSEKRERQKVIVILGPTASGKTGAAVRLAASLKGEIISCDSRQVYRGMDLGTGKDLEEYTLPSGEKIPYHLIDIADPNDTYNLAEFLRDCHKALALLREKNVPGILAGGSALYLDGILRQYQLKGGAPDEKFRQELWDTPTEKLQEKLRNLEPDSPILLREKENRSRLIRRIEMLLLAPDSPLLEGTLGPEEGYDFFVTGIFRPREEIRSRIEIRLRQRLEMGMIEEISALHKQGVPWEKLEFFGLEYRYIALYLQGKLSYEEMFTELLAKIRQFAKRQDSWFRYLERHNVPIYWFREGEEDLLCSMSRDFLAGKPLPEPSLRLSETFYGRRDTGSNNLQKMESGNE